ncbi:ABC transporter substrate-binding protein [Algoriphagus sp. A40]|uniref:ABC transporter substrate-binding protein n=1 Tax=Algoriphagus sp. A40 TaxID=1945863 RepID=UPI0009854974|nr:helical backbone metal receptor [Algoriphagus sp. A40]OOG78445.1 cobalamin-binding protein [Algoriphagus sp. A40]
MNFTDHLSRTIFLPKPPERIISLVPSQTELLVDLGLEDRIVGVTKFCVHPSHLRKSKTIVGGTKNYRFDVIEQLQPDLIIGNKEENDQAGIEKLASKNPVWMSDIFDLRDSLRMISELGKITMTESRASELVTKIESSFAKAAPFKGTCVYLIWENPKMAAGKHTFIDAMLALAGFENVVLSERYPVMSEDKLLELSPDFLILSSEPFPFMEKHLETYQKLLPNSKILLVDGELFSWYGSRLLYASDYFKRL